MHLWHEKVFGYSIRPYTSVGSAIASFPSTATAIGVRRHAGVFVSFVPFGVDDLFKLVVRPNKVQITVPIYEAKVARWRPLWPHLTFVPWSENPRDYGKLDSNAQKVRRADNIA